MINHNRFYNNYNGQTIVLVLLYLLIVSVLISSILILSLNTANVQTSESKFLTAKLLAKSKIDQILGAEDDLFLPNEISANSYFNKIKPLNSSESLIGNSIIDKSNDGIESLGKIEFINSGNDNNSRVTCTKNANSEIDRFYLPPYKSFQVDIGNTSTVNLAYSKTEILLFTVYFQVSSATSYFTSVEFALSTNLGSNSSGNVITSNGNFIYPPVKNDGINLKNFLYRGSQISSDQEVVVIDISSLVSNVNSSSILRPGETVSNVKKIEIVNVSDRNEDAELTLWGNQIPSNIIKLNCFSELGYYDTSGTQATYNVSIYYPSGLVMPNFLNYALAVGKYSDNSGNANYVLAK